MYDRESRAFCLPNALNEQEGQELCEAFRKGLPHDSWSIDPHF